MLSGFDRDDFDSWGYKSLFLHVWSQREGFSDKPFLPIRMPSLKPALTIVAVMLMVGVASGDIAAEGGFFESKVRPLLAERCYQCHSEKAAEDGKLKGGLRVDSLAGLMKGGDSGPSIVTGDPEKSRLITAIGYLDEDMAMPPKGKLADDEIAILTEWVRGGAHWPGADKSKLAALTESEEPYDWAKFRREHWSFQPVAKPALPNVQDDSWSRGDLDRFVLAKLEGEALSPNSQASKRVLIRRAYLDVIGLPPGAKEVQEFLHDESSDAFAKIVDSLLNSEHYGERWARHWMDVARYSDESLPNAWRYRDWLVQALNADIPYDAFVTRQIVGDLLEEAPDPVATGFFVVGPTYGNDGGDPEAVAVAEAETLSDRVDTFSRAFLGLTVACARCHDHKFDPVTIKDYYALAGIFRNSGLGEHPVDPKEKVEAYHEAQKAIGAYRNKINEWLKEQGKRLNQKANQVPKHLDEAGKAALAEMRAEEKRMKDSLPPKFAFAHVLAESGSNDMHVALRGDLRKKGALVPRRFLQVLSDEELKAYAKEGSGRQDLAQSVTDPSNPLTARVIVNRVWQWHFGKALVRTPSNFGVLGEKPTHPKLLDWLAADFMKHGWSLKRLHRQILLSSTWQMSSAFDDENFAKDGDNRLLWRMNPRKLEAEAWRDTVLAVTGELDRKVGGKPENEILESTRRTLYATVSRNGDRRVSDEFLSLFDFPAPQFTSAERSVSTVPQQYLFMMNSPFMKARSETLGHGLASQTVAVEERIGDVYERLYSRPAEPGEVELGKRWVGKDTDSPETWSRYAQVLLSAHELFQNQ